MTTISTLYQDAATKKDDYGFKSIIEGTSTIWEDIIYLPYDDVATKRISVLCDVVGYSTPGKLSGEVEQCPLDFMLDNVAAGGGTPPRAIQYTGALTQEIHTFGTAKSFVMMHVSFTSIGPAFVNASFGTAGATTSKITIGGGVCTVDFTNSIQDDASATTTLPTSGIFAVAAVVDRTADTISFYEANLSSGDDLTLVNSIAITNGVSTAFALDDPTAVAINPSFSLDAYGTLLLSADGGEALPGDLVADLSEMAHSWAAGVPKLVL